MPSQVRILSEEGVVYDWDGIANHENFIKKMCLSDDENLPLQSPKGKRIMNFNCISISGIMDREHLTSIGKFEH